MLYVWDTPVNALRIANLGQKLSSVYFKVEKISCALWRLALYSTIDERWMKFGLKMRSFTPSASLESMFFAKIHLETKQSKRDKKCSEKTHPKL